MFVLKRKSDAYEHLILVIRHFFKNRIKKQIKWNENNIYNNKVSLFTIHPSIHPFFYFFNTLLKDTRKNLIVSLFLLSYNIKIYFLPQKVEEKQIK